MSDEDGRKELIAPTLKFIGHSSSLPWVEVRLIGQQESLRTVGIIDSGATNTMIPKDINEILGSRIIKKQHVRSIGGTFEVDETIVDLHVALENVTLLSLKEFRVLVDESNLPFVVLGYDVFQHLTFQFRRGELVFAFPSVSEEVTPQDQEILGAAELARYVLEREQIIDHLQDLVDRGATEDPEIHDLLKQNPWLIGPSHRSVSHEQTLERILKKYFRIDVDLPGGKKRPDVTVMRGLNELLVIEIKRPGNRVGRNELEQIAYYVDFLRETASPSEGPDTLRVTGVLIVNDFNFKEVGTRVKRSRLAADGIATMTWSDMLDQAREFNRDFLEFLKSRTSDKHGARN